MLIPEYGMIGAAIGTAVSYASIEVSMTLRAWRKPAHASVYFDVQEIDSYRCPCGWIHARSPRMCIWLTGATWEYTAFIVGYFLIVQQGKNPGQH